MTGAVPTPALPPPETLRRTLSRLKSIPTLPRLLDGVARALEDPNVKFEAVAELIEVDQALTSQILRLANSAFYSPSQGSVGRVTQALLLLGAVVTRSLVLSSGVLDMRKIGLKGFWEHSLGCAVAAGALAKVTGLAQPEEATVAGLLHDIGKVVLYKELPDVFVHVLERARMEGRRFRDVEREVLGIDHADIAAWVIEKWRLPPFLAEPIQFHHTPTHARAARDATAIVHVANALVCSLGYGDGGSPRVPPIDPAAWTRLRLAPAGLDRVLDCFEADLDRALNYAIFE